MKKAILLGSLLLLLIPFTASAKMEDTKEKITNFMEKSLDMYNIPGTSLAILENGEMIYQNQWGILSDGSNVTADTPFLIGSLSKQTMEYRTVSVHPALFCYLPLTS